MTTTPIKPETIERLEDAVPAALATRIGCDAERLQRLLHALVVAGLLEKRADGAFANRPEADAFLVEGRPGYRGGGHKLTAHLWEVDLALGGRTLRALRPAQPIRIAAAPPPRSVRRRLPGR